ncbi:MAG: hypothetical protein AAF665_09350 [Pseudomonadota bacterium]
MQLKTARLTGSGSGVVKYDIITALSVMALHSSATLQTTVMRLIAVVTARYNWRTDQLTVPQPDLARMWHVSERTVKRELKRMVGFGLLMCIRPGVRGRVAAYRLNYAELYRNTRQSWSAVGEDFESRMQDLSTPEQAKVVRVDFTAKATPLPVSEKNDLWTAALQELAETDPAHLHNWYMKLALESERDTDVVLRAPSAFVAQFVQTHLASRLVTALERQKGCPVRVEIRS